jgi:hypothetical protein
MTATERRASASLASIFALRMLGLFLVLPVFALEAAKYPGGDDPARVGLAMGIYGLTQGLLQIPFGHRLGLVGPQTRDYFRPAGVCPGQPHRGLGARPATGWSPAARCRAPGAISAAVTALLADPRATRCAPRPWRWWAAASPDVRALAGGGAAAGGLIGLHGLFALTGALALAGIAVVVWWVPPEPVEHVNRPRGSLAEVLKDPALLRLDFGVFVLHAVQLAMWVAIPALLVAAGLDKAATGRSTCRRCWPRSVVMGAVCSRWSAAATCGPCSWARSA